MTQPQSHSQAIVEFITTAESFTSPAALGRLERAGALAALLQEHLAEGSRRLGTSKEYLRKVSPLPFFFFYFSDTISDFFFFPLNSKHNV